MIIIVVRISIEQVQSFASLLNIQPVTTRSSLHKFVVFFLYARTEGHTVEVGTVLQFTIEVSGLLIDDGNRSLWMLLKTKKGITMRNRLFR